MLNLLRVLAAFSSGVAIASVLATIPESAPEYATIVKTYSGDIYAAGTGDTCANAWLGAQIPDDWREISCQKIN